MLRLYHQYMPLYYRVGILISKLYYIINTCLYTIEACIDDIIELANKNPNSLQLLGVKLVDVHKLLELVLYNTYFMYSQ